MAAAVLLGAAVPFHLTSLPSAEFDDIMMKKEALVFRALSGV